LPSPGTSGVDASGAGPSLRTVPTVEVTTDIAAPPEEVFSVVADFEQGPKWQRNMTSAGWTSAPPRGVGSTFEQHARFMGRDMTAAYEVTEYDAPRVVAIRSTSAPFPIEVRRVLEAHDGGTRITETSSGGPEGAGKVLSPLMKPLLRSTIARDYRKLKALLEA
jgi:uncharacterized protein YndB with AHSA1/START domain